MLVASHDHDDINNNNYVDTLTYRIELTTCKINNYSKKIIKQNKILKMGCFVEVT